MQHTTEEGSSVCQISAKPYLNTAGEIGKHHVRADVWSFLLTHHGLFHIDSLIKSPSSQSLNLADDPFLLYVYAAHPRVGHALTLASLPEPTKHSEL